MTDTSRPGAYLVDGHLFFRMPDRSTILCRCIGEPFAGMIVDMWNEQLRNARQAHPDLTSAFPNDWRSRCDTGEESA